MASKDIADVVRTSTEASRQGTVPIYQLYAIPGRDACAGYSSGGFKTAQDYQLWIDKITLSLKTNAVFAIEADAIAQTIRGGCMNPQQITERYTLLKDTVTRLKASPQVLATYLDAGHPEWFPDPSVLTEPLTKSGIATASGIAVNVSFYEASADTARWSQKLITLLSPQGQKKGAIIDTSRNGRGAPADTVTGQARWCNPPGRGIGPIPATNVASPQIHAYFWGKITGESDGDCFGHPPAGTFEPEAALELARNAAN